MGITSNFAPFQVFKKLQAESHTLSVVSDEADNAEDKINMFKVGLSVEITNNYNQFPTLSKNYKMNFGTV